MSQPTILPSLLLCISLLLPIVSPQHQSQWTGSFRRALLQQPSNHGGRANAISGSQENRTRRASPVFAREFLTAHNKVRKNFTHPLFEWDRKLARYARRWGMKRVSDCKMIHSYGPYGENLFWGALSHWTPTKAVDGWSSEREYYDAENNTCEQGQMCGHYTQIIWKNSVKLGCARIQCLTGGVLIICEYDPPGNFVHESPFGTGGVTGSPQNSAETVPSPPSTPNSSSPTTE